MPTLMFVLVNYVLITAWSCRSVLCTVSVETNKSTLGLLSFPTACSLLRSVFMFAHSLKSIPTVSSRNLLTFLSPYIDALTIIHHTEAMIVVLSVIN